MQIGALLHCYWQVLWETTFVYDDFMQLNQIFATLFSHQWRTLARKKKNLFCTQFIAFHRISTDVTWQMW